MNVIDLMAFDVLAYPSINNFNLFTTCGVVPLSTTRFLLSEAACAIKQQPDTLIVWVGNNDALQALTSGAPPTDPQVFATQYELLLATLKASGAKLVIANVPDVTHLPFLIQCPGGSYVVPKLADPPGPSDLPNACSGTDAHFTQIDGSLVMQAQNAVLAYNTTIAAEAKQFGATLVDVYSLFKNVHQNGYPLGTATLEDGPGGGLFSLDLIHPTNTGYAILANTFISAMNKAIQPKSARIPLVCVNQVAVTDRLVSANGIPVTGCVQ
jgi:phospholipase/lecithinase/hemolysin